MNYSRLTQVYCRRNDSGQGGHRRQNPLEGKTEGNISRIAITATVRAAERTTENLYFFLPPYRLRNSCGPHRHLWCGQMDKGDALLLAVPPYGATHFPCIHLLILSNYPHHHLWSGQEDK